jgi:hypothetical protein
MFSCRYVDIIVLRHMGTEIIEAHDLDYFFQRV